jgi:hypothetical protein
MAQFAADSLELLRQDALPILVCHLTDDTPLQAPEPLLFLNRAPHFELFAQYKPDTVGDAVAIVLGSPPGSSVACQGASPAGLRDCQLAWQAQLAARGAGVKR